METMKMKPPLSLTLDMAAINRENNNMNFSNCSSPYISAPSSPQRTLNFFYSAPASPRHFDRDDFANNEVNDPVVPFNWEFKPGVPKSENEDEDESFEFEFSGQLDMMVRPSLSSADELFDGGKIKPLKPPPPMIESPRSPKSPKSPISKFRDALSPKQRKKKLENEQDPFESALKKSTEIENPPRFNDFNRGRSRNLSNSNSRKGISRSLSPLRVSEFAKLQPQNQPNNDVTGSSSSRWGSKKWRLKDFLLFRSASEGRATEKDPLKKYFFSGKKVGEEERDKEGSFRSVGSSSMADGSVSRRRGHVSAHEMHYAKKKAVSEEMKKKTTLPYKHGLLGCLGFNPALHDISKAFGSFARS